MEDKFKKVVVTDGDGNVKNIQEYKYNDHGDPIWFRKTVNEKVITDVHYTYEYDEHCRKTKMAMEDKIDGRITVLNYEY